MNKHNNLQPDSSQHSEELSGISHDHSSQSGAFIEAVDSCHADLIFTGTTEEKAKGEGASKNILRATTLIGSSTSCNVRLVSGSVSSSHAVITYDHRELRIWDLRSRTGTFVNGKKVIYARLHDGDRVRVGKFEFVVSTNIMSRSRKGFFVDDYRIIDLLGTGGMGWLYIVEYAKTGERMALKVLTRQGADENEMRMRFWFEGRIGRKVQHPNIIKAIGYQCRKDVDYILMELVESITLQELISNRRKIKSSFACSIISQIASALEHIHQLGSVHRDIKPANVLIDNQGHVKLCDFGLVYLGDEPQEDIIAQKMAGDCLGTVDFISPEQSHDSYSIDGRADVYSLGCTLYLALTGKVPYEGKTALEKLEGHRNTPVASILTAESGFPIEDVPEGVKAIIEKAMQKNPDDRFVSAAEMVLALEPFAVSQPLSFNFKAILEKRKARARMRLTDSNRSHHLDRIPANILLKTLEHTKENSAKNTTKNKMPASPQTPSAERLEFSNEKKSFEDGGTNHRQEPANQMPGDTAPSGTSPENLASHLSPELKKLSQHWDDIPNHIRTQILNAIPQDDIPQDEPSQQPPSELSELGSPTDLALPGE